MSNLKQSKKKSPSQFWKRFGYVGLIVSILAGAVKIIEYFQKPTPSVSSEQHSTKPDSVFIPSGLSTSGDQSPATYAPGGNVTISYESKENPGKKK